MLKNAIQQFASKAPNTWTYLGGSNPGWADTATMAQRLNNAGVKGAHGFSLNVSNFFSRTHNHTYGNDIRTDLTDSYGYTKPFVIDTSRDGKGSNGEWCNPVGRQIGWSPQFGGGAEVLLWLKTPGESDGNCGVGAGTIAGQFSPAIAYNLIYGY